jgi:hypothetical protein
MCLQLNVHTIIVELIKLEQEGELTMSSGSEAADAGKTQSTGETTNKGSGGKSPGAGQSPSAGRENTLDQTPEQRNLRQP